MEKIDSNVDWLDDFKIRFQPSDSFLDIMNLSLKEEYSSLFENNFDNDVDYFIVDNDDEPIKFFSKEAFLKGTLKFRNGYSSECFIYWKNKPMDAPTVENYYDPEYWIKINKQRDIFKPHENISKTSLIFKWILLELPESYSLRESTK